MAECFTRTDDAMAMRKAQAQTCHDLHLEYGLPASVRMSMVN